MRLDMLTPVHLSYRNRLCSMPDDMKNNAKNHEIHQRTRYFNSLREQLWSRWSREYLMNLKEHHRSKTKQGKKIAEGDIVIIHDKSKPRSEWRLGKVSKLLMGEGGYARGVEVEIVDRRGDPKKLQRPLRPSYSLELANEIDAKEKEEVENGKVTGIAEVVLHQEETVGEIQLRRDRPRIAEKVHDSAIELYIEVWNDNPVFLPLNQHGGTCCTY